MPSVMHEEFLRYKTASNGSRPGEFHSIALLRNSYGEQSMQNQQQYKTIYDIQLYSIMERRTNVFFELQ